MGGEILSDNRFGSRQQLQKESFTDTIIRIKNGDSILKNKFINDYKPFILKTVSQLIGNNPDLESSEEFSIGLLAFNEALESYDEDKKNSFISFSKQVISRRIIDYMRSNKKNKQVFPFSYFEEYENNFEEKYLGDKNVDQFSNFEIQEEFDNFELIISKFEISLDDLALRSPKHKKSRKTCLGIAKVISEDDILYEMLMRKRKIPFKQLKDKVSICQRTIEKNRKYIIAMTLVLKSDLEVLRKYIIECIQEGG